MRYFINGMFLQMGEGIGVRTIPGAGSVAVFETKTRGYIFNGVIQRLNSSNPWTGWVLDHFGYATLTNIVFGDGELRFTKKYEGCDDEIHCTFRKHPDAEAVLVGYYEGVDTGKNTAWCMMTGVSDRMFDEGVIKGLAAGQPKLPIVTLDADQEREWREYKRAGGTLPAAEIPRVNEIVQLCAPDGRSIATAYLNSNDIKGGLPDGRTNVTVSATVRTRFC